ncbi:hypothetical protein F4801DRAFT_307861 [Xylaria longipes]|nr:hypothetical protein F4801DRAFT_307861 [Xylaria longipes]
MSFPHALQSLVFYIASCAPCYQARQKYRIEQQAKRMRAAKERDGMNRRGYQQPEPFSTNPYWSEEIRMGPHVDRKKFKTTGQPHVTTCGVIPSSLVPPNPTTNTPATNPTKPTNPTNTAATNPTNTEATNAGTVNSTSSWETMYADTSGANTLNSVDTVIVRALNTSTTNTGTANTSTANTSITNTGTFRTLFTNTSTASSVQENEKASVNASRSSDVVNITAPKAPSPAAVDDVVNITTPKTPSPAAVEDERYRLSPDITPTLPANWNHKRYQREDEELWGSEFSRTSHKLMDAIKHAGSSAGRFIEYSLSKDVKLNYDDDDEDCYFIPVNRPLNDYHPPIARRPPFKGKVQWMVQPPPPAKLMEGKIRASSPGDASIYSDRHATPINKDLDARLSASRGSSASNPSRHATRSNKGKETALPVSRGSTISNSSQRTTASATYTAGLPRMTLAEMV